MDPVQFVEALSKLKFKDSFNPWLIMDSGELS